MRFPDSLIRRYNRLKVRHGDRIAAMCGIKNRVLCRPRILLYADSRGLDIARKHLREHPLGFYPWELIKLFDVDYHVLLHKHTTIVDFLFDFEKKLNHYDIIVCHVGIVDFSPRKQASALRDLYLLKKEKYDAIFPQPLVENHIQNGFDTLYEGERTANMFSADMLKEHVIPRLKNHPGIIWIGQNQIARDWNGTYERNRPDNIGIICDYDRIVRNELKNSISFDEWSEDDIKRLTYDNIHLNRSGAQWMLDRLIPKIKLVAKKIAR